MAKLVSSVPCLRTATAEWPAATRKQTANTVLRRALHQFAGSSVSRCVFLRRIRKSTITDIFRHATSLPAAARTVSSSKDDKQRSNPGNAELVTEDGLLIIRPPALPLAAPAANEYPIRRIKLRACQGLYNMPINGLEFACASFVDTGTNPYFYTNPYGVRTLIPAPVILFIHDTPGSHEDFGACIKLFSQCGARVVAPNLPGFGHSSLDTYQLFSHDTVQRVSYIMSILERLQINRIDMVVALGHGSVCAVPLASRLNMSCRSLCLINPMPALPPRAMMPFVKYEFFSSLWKWQAMRPYLNAPIDYLSSIVDPHRRFPDRTARAAIVCCYGSLMYEKYLRQLREMPFETLDTLFIMTKNDPIFSEFELREVGHILGATKDRISTINERNEMTRGAPIISERQYLRGVCFDTGGRTPHAGEQQAKMVQQMLLELYNYTCRKYGMRLRMLMSSTATKPQTTTTTTAAAAAAAVPTWDERQATSAAAATAAAIAQRKQIAASSG